MRPSAALFVLLTILALGCSSGGDGDQDARPNILLIVADDLGWSDPGCYGGEIDTPHLDHLSRQGMLFTNFHVAGGGAPTRSMLLTGVDHHKTGLAAGVGQLAASQRGQPGYEGYLNQNVVTVANLLRDEGYKTWISGKWDMGAEIDQGPDARGVDKSFVLLGRAGNHYVERGTSPDHPTVLYRRDGAVVHLPQGFYSSDSYTDQVIEWIGEGRGGADPFFACLSYTAPHWPLQVDAARIEKYEGRYGIGWDAVRSGRFDRQRSKGLIGPTASLPRRAQGVRAWADLSSAERKLEARRMAVYAAMVEKLDDNLGRLVDHLRKAGELERTVIFVLSDNGSEAWVPGSEPRMKRWIEETFNNDPSNLGAADSFMAYGPGWAQVSATPHRLHKGTTAEGALRVPLVAYFPKNPEPGKQSRGFATAMDLAATILDLGGAKSPTGSYKGRSVHPVEGRSMMPVLVGKASRIHDPEEAIGFELFGHQALVMGEFKLLRQRPPYGDGRFELYDLIEDPSEMQDLGPSKPERKRRMIEQYEEYAREAGVIPPPEDFDPGH